MDKKLKDEIRSAKQKYDESGAILDYMRYDYLRRGSAAFSPENAMPE